MRYLQRMHKQMDEDAKMRLCDAVIRNDEEEGADPAGIGIA